MANPAIQHIESNLSDFGAGSPNSQAVTLDKVIEKTFITLGLLIVAALTSWYYAGTLVYAPDGADLVAANRVAMIAGVLSFVALGLSFWISFSRRIRKGAILAFAVVEGLVLGVFTQFATVQVGGDGLALAALGGTLITAGVTLFVYKTFNIQVNDKFRRITMIAVFSFVGVSLFDFVLYLFHADLGLNGFGFNGFLFSILGLGIALMMLITDFDAVERAIEYRLPEDEAWRLAFGLTVTLVWIYINLLKILRYMRR